MSRRPLSFEVMAAMVSRLSDLVHAEHPACSQRSDARLHNLWAWDDDAMGLDVLQVHSYPDERRPRDDDVFGMPASAWASAVPSFWESFRATDLRSIPTARRRQQRRSRSIWNLR